MKVIFKPRQCGKTFEAAKIANDTGAYLVVDNVKQAKLIHKYFETKRFPLTFWELMESRLDGSYVQNIVIDNLDHFIQDLFPHLTIEAVTLTNPYKHKPPFKYRLKPYRKD